jgi:glycosyltransferase involved in cell wall biosynthesis
VLFRSLLKEAELFLHTSLSEGLPLAVLEAMVYGTPVLISPFCNLPEIAAAGAGVILPLEVTTIAEALAELLRDESGRVQMGLNARQLVAERFTWSRVGELTEKLCTELAR